jgi:hypothetical protein
MLRIYTRIKGETAMVVGSIVLLYIVVTVFVILSIEIEIRRG